MVKFTTKTIKRVLEMMLLLEAIEAEVEPVPGKAGWFRLTGRDILLVDYPNAIDYIEDAEEAGRVVHHAARIEGMHDKHDVAETDPRFNGEGNGDNFAVIEKNGHYTMVLDVNFPEAALLRHLIKRRGYEDEFLPTRGHMES
jgi:hypothetical protein